MTKHARAPNSINGISTGIMSGRGLQNATVAFHEVRDGTLNLVNHIAVSVHGQDPFLVVRIGGNQMVASIKNVK